MHKASLIILLRGELNKFEFVKYWFRIYWAIDVYLICVITPVCVCVYIYIYIYIYICSHPQLFSVARHVGHLKLGLKPTQLYVRLCIRPLSQQVYHIVKGIIRYYVATAAAAFVCLHFVPYQIPRGVMVKAMHCGIVVREFVLQSRYYFHFRANTLGKGMNPLILPPAMGK